MRLQPATYEAALKRARSRPQKARKPLRSRSVLKTSPAPLQRQQSLSRKATKKPKRKKKLTTGQWKKKAWKEFSIFIRTRGANEAGLNKCVTCGVVAHWKTLQAGHFIRGRLNSNLFDDRGCWAQCYGCNVGRQGNVVVYYKFMLAKFGQEVIDELMRQNDETHKWAAGELESVWLEYKELNAANPLLREGLTG